MVYLAVLFDGVRGEGSLVRRRDCLKLIAGLAVAWPRIGRAQQPSKLPRIGVIDNAPIWDHFRERLRDLGYVEDRNIVIEYRAAEGRPDRLAAAAAELVGLPVDIIATYGSAATQAAKQATSTIPIVMTGIGDAVRAGFVANLARPEGNITGNTILGPVVVAKRLQLLKLAVPNLSRLAVLWNPNNASHAAYLDEWRAAAPGLGAEILLVAVRSSEELEGAFAAMMQQRPDALTVTADPLHQAHIEWIIDFLARNRLPGAYQARENVVAGGLMSYGANLPDLFRRAANYVHRILQGARPADLPVEQPTKFELVVNLKTAKALGLTIPEPFLLVADEVIE
jgi:putative tryptophan/tyrosine transport system substrate-binding protein